MTIDKRIIDAYASPIKEWEANHQNDTNIILFLYEMINVAVDKTAGTKMGWKHHECGVDYDSKVIEDSLTGKKTRIVSREESAWTLGLVAFSWLTKIVQGKVEVGHCHTHKKATGKPCQLGKKLHLRISKEIAKNLRDIAYILDPVNSENIYLLARSSHLVYQHDILYGTTSYAKYDDVRNYYPKPDVAVEVSL